MPRIDDRAAIQLALFEVLSRLSGGDIDYKRGGILLYGLQIASSNLPRHATQAAEQQPQVDEVTHDIHLGDLAPIAEFPTPDAEEEVVILSAANGVPGQLAGWGRKNPRIPPEAPKTSGDTPQPALSLPKGLAPEIGNPSGNRQPAAFSPSSLSHHSNPSP
jgi:hypothetical protein